MKTRSIPRARRPESQAGRQLRTIVDSVKDYAIFMLDRDGHVLTWNAGAEAIKGYTRDEIVGSHISRFYQPADVARQHPREMLDRARQEGRVEEEGWRVRKDGSRFWADVVITAIPGPGGEVDAFVKVTRDLTFRKKAQEELEQRGQQERALTEASRLGLQTRELPRLFRRAIELLLQTLGADLAVVLERDTSSGGLRLACGHGWDRDGSTEADGRSVSRDGGNGLARYPVQVLRELHSRSAHPVVGHLVARGMRSGIVAVIPAASGEGDFGLLLACGHDPRSYEDFETAYVEAFASVLAAAVARLQSEADLLHAEREAAGYQRQTALAEEALRVHEEALRVRDEFISVAAHELRTPLTSLQLKLQGIERILGRGQTLEPAHLQGRMSSALRQTERMNELIERLLDVTRMEAGGLTLEPRQVEMGALVRKVVDDHRELLGAAGCSISLALASSDTRGFWDPRRIEQVIANLLTNAAKYGAGQPVEVGLRPDGDDLIITVRDHGIGIAPEDVDRVFGRFERAAPATEYAGLGLGLYIIRHLVSLHQGHIDVASVPGQGATFTVRLPRTPTLREVVAAPHPWGEVQ